MRLRQIRLLHIFLSSAILLAVFLLPPSVLAESQSQLPVVSLITVGPGEESYQLEGHTALRLRFPGGRDISVHWGVFDFNTPNFAYRFVKGETDYSIGVAPTLPMVYGYDRENRWVKEQVLNLSAAETETLVDLISENLLPPNRIYRYNYVLDNCATRPLAMIEKALTADSCRLVVGIPQSATTFREEMRRYHKFYPAYQMFIDYALGSGIDRPITPRQQAFAPVFLEQLAGSATIVGPDGSSRPLVAATDTLACGSPHPWEENLLHPWIIVAAITILASLMTFIDQRRRRVSRWFDAIFYAIYGILGLVLTFLIFVSTHEATSPNVNYLWLNPLCLIVPCFIAFRGMKMVVFWYQIINFAFLMAYLIGIPFFDQSINLLFIPLVFSDLIRSVNYIVIVHQDRIPAKQHKQSKHVS